MARGMNQDRAKRTIVEPSVIEILLGHQGVPITLDEIMDGLPAGAQEASVRSVMRRLVEGDKMDITVLSRGNSWRLESNNKPEPKPDTSKSLGLFEQVGEMQDGSLVVRDERNRLYSLKAL